MATQVVQLHVNLITEHGLYSVGLCVGLPVFLCVILYITRRKFYAKKSISKDGLCLPDRCSNGSCLCFL